MAEPSSFCEKPRTVVGPPAYRRSCGGMKPVLLSDLPNTTPPRTRNAITAPFCIPQYCDRSTRNLLKRSELSESVTGDACLASILHCDPAVGEKTLFELSRETIALTTAKRCVC